MSAVKFIYLSQEDVIACGALDMAATMETVEEAFRVHGKGDYRQPNKVSLRWSDEETTEETKGRLMAMPAYIGGRFAVAGIKWIPSVPSNPKKCGLPRASALIILNDPETGLPLAVMDGTVISAMRTGAVSGVGAKYLARPNSRVLAIVGAGVQARTQLAALRLALPRLELVKIYDPDRERASVFAAEVANKYRLEVNVCSEAKEAIKGCDVLTTPTVAIEPYVEPEWLKPGCYYADISSHDAKVEVYLRADKLVVDDWGEVKHYDTLLLTRAYRAGLLSDKHIYAEIGQIVTGQKPGRESEEEVIVFHPVGLGIIDIAAAYRVYQLALARGVGIKLPLWEKPLWV